MMVWGCFSWGGVGSLVFIRDKLTALKYVDIVNDHIILSATEMGIQSDFVFQQDNDPKHTARVTKDFFEEVTLEVLPWPSYSPDINPIEHLWDELDRKIPQSRRKRLKDFEAALQEHWYAISSERIEKLIESMPRRLAAVVHAKGYYTRY